jgi:hypothetical protein
MVAARTSETLVKFYQTTWCYNPEDSHLRTHCHENLKSYCLNISYGTGTRGHFFPHTNWFENISQHKFHRPELDVLWAELDNFYLKFHESTSYSLELYLLLQVQTAPGQKVFALCRTCCLVTQNGICLPWLS